MKNNNIEQYKIKVVSLNRWSNKLLIIFIMMFVIMLPKRVFAQQFNNDKQIISGESKVNVKLPNTEYSESTIDLRVKVLGGEVKLNRTWINGRWYLNPAWANLRFILDPLDSSIKTIDRAGTIYQRTGEENLYSYEQVSIKKTDLGWRWFDREGNWINFDTKGRILEYGDINNIKVSFVLDSEGRRIAIKDHFDELVYSFTYDEEEHLINVIDRENRIVSYEWSGDKLVKVTDVVGNQWLYDYDQNGQINKKTEPDGGIIKIDYILSTPAPKTAMTSGKEGGIISQNTVITLGSANRDTKLAQVGKITDKTGAVTIYNSHYDRVKRQYTITTYDPLGKKTATKFDINGRVLSRIVNDSYIETYQRDDVNHLVKYTNQRGLTTTTQYNQDNYPIKIIYPNGATEFYEYNNTNKLTKLTNAKGNIITFEYNAYNQPTKIVYALGKPEQRIITVKYDKYGQQIAAEVGEGEQVICLQQTFDHYGNMDSYIDAKGNKYQYTYDIQGQIKTIQDPLKQKWKFNYNLAGYTKDIIDPLNQISHLETDFMGRPVEVVDAQNNKVQYSYSFNQNGYEIKEINALNQITVYKYDILGNHTKTISSTGLESQQVYNLEGKIEKETDVAGNTLTYEYGKQGSELASLLIKRTYPTFSETYNYDALGNKTEINQFLENNIVLTKRNVYDQLGLITSTIDAANRVKQVENNALGQLIKFIDASGNETHFSGDLLGNLTQITDANGNQYAFEFDKNNNLIKETKALGNDIEYSYNEANQLVQEKDANGNIVQYLYDAVGNNIQQNYFEPKKTEPSQVVTFKYNENNQIIDVLQTGETNTHFIYQYDSLYRIIQETITYGSGTNSFSKILKYSYDQEGNLASITYPDNSKINYSYDKNQLKRVELANGAVIDWSDYKWRKPAKVIYPNAVKTNRYDSLQRYSQISVISNNKTIFDRQYFYDKVGNITQIKTENGENHYQYDVLDRLIQDKPSAKLQEIGIATKSYSYDAIGNRIGSTQQSEEWTYNNFNQLIKWGENNNQTIFTYNRNGQLATEVTVGKNLSYHYNAVGRLVTIKNNDIVLANYQYDPYGRRISKTVNGETTYYIYTDEGLIAELDNNGELIVAYGWQPDTDWGTSPLWYATLTVNQTLQVATYNYLIADHLGTPQLAINNQGQITWKIYNDAFGNTVLDPNNQITLNLRFPGQYYDNETGLSYNYFRDYNPKIGRYIQSDPIGLNGGINTFGYVTSNPILYSDPTGQAIPLVVITGARLCLSNPTCSSFALLGASIAARKAAESISSLLYNYFPLTDVITGYESKYGSGSDSYSPHPDEEEFLNKAEGIEPAEWTDPWKNDDDKCKELRNAIDFLVEVAKKRARDLKKYDGGNVGHIKRYNRVKDALQILIKQAKERNCSYNPEADYIVNKNYQNVVKLPLK